MVETITPVHTLVSTACWTASVRAMERVRADRLFDDPWAAALAGAEGAAWLARRSANSVVPIIVRTRFFDDFLQRITHQHAIRQVVLLAAGLDTRAFRLPWPSQTRLFELDQPPVVQYKEAILGAAGAQPTCVRQAIEVDLTAPWQERLITAGFDPHCPAGWLIEGFLFYLSRALLTQLLEEVTRLAAPGSWLGFDILNSTVLTSSLTRSWVDMQAESDAPWIGTMDDPVGFLRPHGWNATLTQAGQPDANYDRWPYPIIPTTMPNMPHHWFVIAQKEAPRPS